LNVKNKEEQTTAELLRPKTQIETMLSQTKAQAQTETGAKTETMTAGEPTLIDGQEDPLSTLAAELLLRGVSTELCSATATVVTPSSPMALSSPMLTTTTSTEASVVSGPTLPSILPAPSEVTLHHHHHASLVPGQMLFVPVQPGLTSYSVALRSVVGEKPQAASSAGDTMAISSPESSPSQKRRRSRSATDSKTKRKRKTPEQLSILEREFEANPMPNKEVRDHLSSHLGLTSRQVQIWFQNKRAKVKNARGGGGSGGSGSQSSPEASPRSSPPLATAPGVPSPPPIFPEGFSEGQLFFDVVGGSSLPLFSLSNVPLPQGSQLHLNIEPTAFQNEYMRLKQTVDA
jgi:hypothetical protein